MFGFFRKPKRYELLVFPPTKQFKKFSSNKKIDIYKKVKEIMDEKGELSSSAICFARSFYLYDTLKDETCKINRHKARDIVNITKLDKKERGVLDYETT